MNQNKKTYFSIFSGIGGFDLSLNRQGYECIGYSEINKHSIQTYEKNFGTEIKNYGDATKINPNELPDFNLLCGGFPCQAFSIAGKRMGFKDTRGTLFFEIARIAKIKRPQFLFLENVKGLLSHDNRRTFTTILATLDELGYDAEWQVLNSKNFGVPQNRERVFIIGHLRGTSSKQIFPLQNTFKKSDITRTITTAHAHGSSTNMSYIKKQKEPKIITHSLFPRSSKTNKGGTGHLSKDDGTAYCLDSGNCQAIAIPVLTPDRENKRQAGRRFKENGEPSFTLTGQDRHGIMTIANTVTPDADLATGKRKRINGKAVLTSMYERRIRRLTPIECERLQGFPDRFTEGVSDTQRYNQLGNAVTVNVVEEIIKKINTTL